MEEIRRIFCLGPGPLVFQDVLKDLRIYTTDYSWFITLSVLFTDYYSTIIIIIILFYIILIYYYIIMIVILI